MKRATVIMQQILLFCSSVGYLICIFLADGRPQLRTGFCIALIVATLWHIALTRCPHCGRFSGLRHKTPPKDAVRCIHCGETTEYQ